MRYIRMGLVGSLAAVGVFQAALAAGAPWGAAAYGGGNPGILPGELRVASAVSACALAAAAWAAARTESPPARPRRVLLYGLTAFGTGSAIMNALSPSPVERLLWAPVAAIIAATSWLLVRSAFTGAPRRGQA